MARKRMGSIALAALGGGAFVAAAERWINRVSGRTEPKVSYVQKAGKDACLVGAYNP